MPMSTEEYRAYQRAQYQGRVAREMKEVLTANLHPDEMTTVREFAVEPPVRYEDPNVGATLHMTRVRVAVTEFLRPRAEHDQEPYVEVAAYTRLVTTKGTLNERDTPLWRPLVKELVDPLLERWPSTVTE